MVQAVPVQVDGTVVMEFHGNDEALQVLAVQGLSYGQDASASADSLLPRVPTFHRRVPAGTGADAAAEVDGGASVAAVVEPDFEHVPWQSLQLLLVICWMMTRPERQQPMLMQPVPPPRRGLRRRCRRRYQQQFLVAYYCCYFCLFCLQIEMKGEVIQQGSDSVLTVAPSSALD